LTTYPVWRTFHVTSQACKSGCLVPKWLKHWTTDLKVQVPAPLGNRYFIFLGFGVCPNKQVYVFFKALFVRDVYKAVVPRILVSMNVPHRYI